MATKGSQENSCKEYMGSLDGSFLPPARVALLGQESYMGSKDDTVQAVQALAEGEFNFHDYATCGMPLNSPGAFSMAAMSSMLPAPPELRPGRVSRGQRRGAQAPAEKEDKRGDESH